MSSEGSASVTNEKVDHRNVGRALSFVAFLPILLAAVAAALALANNDTLKGSKRDRVMSLRYAATLTAAGNLGGLDRYAFLVPRVIIPFRKEFTVGELTDILQTYSNVALETLVDKYSFRDFMTFLGNSLAIFPGGAFDSVEINADPKPDRLSIWFIDPTTLDDPRKLGNSTCSYLGFADAVVCNTALVSEALAEIAKIDRSHSLGLHYCDGQCPNSFKMNLLGKLDDLRSMRQQNFLIWLIGHEIGHAVKHRNWALQSQQPLHFFGRYDSREAEADHFVGDRVERVPALKASFAALLLEDVDHRFLMLYREHGGSLEMIVPAKNRPEKPLVLDSGPRSALLMRALSMITTILDKNPNALGEIYLRPIGTSLGFVSSFKSREYVDFVNTKVEHIGLTSGSHSSTKWYVVLLTVVSIAGCFLTLRREVDKS